MNNNHTLRQFTVKLLAGTGCTLSVIAGIFFWQQLFVSLAGKVTLSIAAVLFECVKFMALPHIRQAIQVKRYGKAIISALLFVVLTLVSLFGAVTSLNNGLSHSQQASAKSKTQYQQLSQSIAFAESKLQSLIEHMNKDIQNNSRERAKSTLLEISKEETRLKALQQQLNQVELSAVFVEGVSQAQLFKIILVLGCLLELSTAYLICHCEDNNSTGNGLKKTHVMKTLAANQSPFMLVPDTLQGTGTAEPGTQVPTQHSVLVAEYSAKTAQPIQTTQTQNLSLCATGSAVPKVEVQPVPRTSAKVKLVPQVQVQAKPRTSKNVSVNEQLLQQAKQHILKCNVYPSVRELKKYLHRSTDTIRAILKQLQQEGIVTLSKGRYELSPSLKPV